MGVIVFSGDRLRELRNEIGMTQKAMAERFGITEIGYQNYEAGRRNPSISMLPRLADFFDVSTDYLLGRSDDPHLPRMDEETRELFRAVQAFKAKQAQSPPQ